MEIMIGYADVYNDEDLIYQALKLLILSGDQKLFSQILERDWDKVCNISAANVEELWNLTEARYAIHANLMKCVITKTLGQYMKGFLFMKANSALIQYSLECKTHENATILLNAIDHNLIRLNNGQVLNMVLNILKSKCLLTYDKVTDILSSLNVLDCEDSDLEDLNEILKTEVTDILKNNGNPYFIVNLLKETGGLFESVYNLISQNISDEKLSFIKTELGDDEAPKDVLKKNIKILRERFNPDTKVRSFYNDNPLGIITYSVQDIGSKCQGPSKNVGFGSLKM